MEAVNNVLIINIVVLLLNCTSYMHADCVSNQYKILPEGLNAFLQIGVQPVVNSLQTDSRSECALLCINGIFCKMWRFGDGRCQIFHSMKDKISLRNSSTMETYYEIDPDWKWMNMFFVKSGSRFNVASSFLGRGNYESWGPANCTRNGCPDLFRSSLIDVWSDLPIKKVKVSLIKNKKSILYLIFDGQGTNNKNWFTMSRVLESPWKDVKGGATYNEFDIGSRPARSFYMSKVHGLCTGDYGWMFASEPGTACTYDKCTTYPQFLYSNRDSATRWEHEHSRADAMAVYISF